MSYTCCKPSEQRGGGGCSPPSESTLSRNRKLDRKLDRKWRCWRLYEVLGAATRMNDEDVEDDDDVIVVFSEKLCILEFKIA